MDMGNHRNLVSVDPCREVLGFLVDFAQNRRSHRRPAGRFDVRCVQMGSCYFSSCSHALTPCVQAQNGCVDQGSFLWPRWQVLVDIRCQLHQPHQPVAIQLYLTISHRQVSSVVSILLKDSKWQEAAKDRRCEIM